MNGEAAIFYRPFPPTSSSSPPATMAPTPAHNGMLTASVSLTESSMGQSFSAVVSFV